MWAKVDDGFWCHPKVMSLPGSACGLWVRALSWSCAQRSAVVPAHFLTMVGATEDDANALTAVGLWKRNYVGADRPDGWEIHDWAEYQQLSVSEKRAEAGRRGGQRSGEARRSKPKQTDTSTSTDAPSEPKQAEASDEAGTHPVPSRPIPTQVPTSISQPTSVVGEPPAVSDQDVNRAVAEFVRLTVEARNPDDYDAYARSVGRNVTDQDRDLLRETMLTGADPVEAAEALRARLGSQRPVTAVSDPAEVERAREAARKAEEATVGLLAKMRQEPERRMTRDELRALRSEAVG